MISTQPLIVGSFEEGDFLPNFDVQQDNHLTTRHLHKIPLLVLGEI